VLRIPQSHSTYDPVTTSKIKIRGEIGDIIVTSSHGGCRRSVQIVTDRWTSVEDRQ